MKRWLFASALVAYLATLTTQAQSYNFTDIGYFPAGTYSLGEAVNDSGTVAGIGSGSGFFANAFSYSGGTLTDLGTLPGGNQSQGYAINAAGDIGGRSSVLVGIAHAVIYNHGGGITDVASFGTTIIPYQVTGINNSLAVTGIAFPSGGGNSTAFYYAGGSVVDIGALASSPFSQGAGINNVGQSTGFYQDPVDLFHRAYIYDNGTGLVTNLGLLPGIEQSEGAGINDAGHVAGDVETTGGVIHMMYYDGTTMNDLGLLAGSTYTAGLAINNSDEIVGQAMVGGVFVAVIWDSVDGIRDLNSLVSLPGGWTLNVANDISDTGYITGYGTDNLGNNFAFLLDVVPEPSACALLLGGLALLSLVIRRKLHTAPNT